MSSNLVSIIGYGVVGKSIPTTFSFQKKYTPPLKINIIDPRYKSSDFSLEDSAYAFICVPTPSTVHGACDASLVLFYLRYLNDIKYSGVVILKSTVSPDVMERDVLPLTKKLNFVYYPEFLREKHAEADAINPSVVCYSYDSAESLNAMHYLFSMYSNIPSNKIHATNNPISLSLFKYLINSYLAMKVIFMNQYEKLCDKYDVSWDFMIKLMIEEGRIGNTHLNVPNDGEYGYGGKCFPKDVTAIIKAADKVDVNLSLLKETHRYNEEIKK